MIALKAKLCPDDGDVSLDIIDLDAFIHAGPHDECWISDPKGNLSMVEKKLLHSFEIDD